jgi:hypothetical protein
MIHQRLPIRLESHAYRCQGLNCKEVRFQSNLKLLIYVMIKKIRKTSIKSPNYFRFKRVLIGLVMKLKLSIVSHSLPDRIRVIHHHTRLADLSDEELWTSFRIRREDFGRLLIALKMNLPLIRLDNNTVFTGEEILLIARYRFVTGLKLVHMAAVFNREYSQLSRAFNWFIRHMIDNFAYLLTDNLDYWLPDFPHFSECIREKLAEVSGVVYPENGYRVCAFYDDTVLKVCRPGSGPNPDGTRKDTNIQRAFYNGWKKQHGIKFQSLEAPNGMCMHMFGPMSCRRSDVELIELSGLNEKLQELQLGNDHQYDSY